MEQRNTVWPGLPALVLAGAIAVLGHIGLRRRHADRQASATPAKEEESAEQKDPFAWAKNTDAPTWDEQDERDGKVPEEKQRANFLFDRSFLALRDCARGWNRTAADNERYLLDSKVTSEERIQHIQYVGAGGPYPVFSVHKYPRGRCVVRWRRKNHTWSDRFCDAEDLLCTVEVMMEKRAEYIAENA